MYEVRQRWWRRASAKHSHTTHVLSTAAIQYADHPHYGAMVTRMRKCSSFGLHQIQVALPCGLQILIPEWMLDEDRCHGIIFCPMQRALMQRLELFDTLSLIRGSECNADYNS
jgi:hypothetical protein